MSTVRRTTARLRRTKRSPAPHLALGPIPRGACVGRLRPPRTWPDPRAPGSHLAPQLWPAEKGGRGVCEGGRFHGFPNTAFSQPNTAPTCTSSPQNSRHSPSSTAAKPRTKSSHRGGLRKWWRSVTCPQFSLARFPAAPHPLVCAHLSAMTATNVSTTPGAFSRAETAAGQSASQTANSMAAAVARGLARSSSGAAAEMRKGCEMHAARVRRKQTPATRGAHLVEQSTP